MLEQQLLNHVFTGNRQLPGRITIAPGDDMGAVSVGAGDLLVTVDQVIDGVHVDLRSATLEQVGRKALTRNLSDVAAMAAWPVGAVASLCLPRSMSDADARRLLDAMSAVGLSYGCPLFGGDIAMWDGSLHLAVTVLAEPAGIEPVLRRGALAGDVLVVSGELGGSLEPVRGRVHHLDFEPRLKLARELARNPATRPHAMIDLSDGLARDAGHLAVAASLVVEIDVAALPVSEASQFAARRDGQPAWRHALSDGEDYELAMATRPESLPAALDGIALTAVGAFRAPAAGETPGTVRLRLPDGSYADARDMGWEHGR